MMSFLNVEIKARCPDLARVRKIVQSHNADFKGTDHQIDTYFKVSTGRLKLREGNIENCLVFYRRDNRKLPKESHVDLFPTTKNSSLKEILIQSLGVLTIIDKKREIYFIDNVKFHLDEVRDLGTFVEIEAIDKDGSIGKENLTRQCGHFITLLGITDNNLVASSYSDLAEKTG